MSIGAVGHTGIIASGMNPPSLLDDLQSFGGGIGYTGSSTKYHFKNVYLKSTSSQFQLHSPNLIIDTSANIVTGLKMGDIVTATGQGLRFEGVTTGVDTTGNTIGHFNLIDSSASNTQAVLSAETTTTTMQGSLLLENAIVDSTVPTISQNHDHP